MGREPGDATDPQISPLRVHALAQTAMVRVAGIECGAPAAPCGAEESDDVPRLVLPRRGVFTWQVRGVTHVAEPGCVLVFTPDEPYRFGHPADGGDSCLLIALHHQTWADLLATARVDESAVRSTRVPLSGAQHHANAMFARATEMFESDPAALEELALVRVAALAGELPGAPPADVLARGRRQRERHRRLAAEAAGFIAAHHCERLPRLLDTVATAVHCSPFHLARVFHGETGTTVHVFRERLRFATALRMLREGADDLAVLADDLGYANHSHFTAAFRRACGYTPSATRQLLGLGPAELRKILTARQVSPAYRSK